MKLTITKYSELARYTCGFAARCINLLVIVGSAGLQKTWLVEKICSHARRLTGCVTAFELYRELWRYRDHDFIIDDIDNLYSDKAAIRLLKNLCDTRNVKTIQWNSASAALNSEGIPKQFETRSRVIIIANEWHTLNKNVGALQDRGVILNFEPDAEEVHRQVGLWFDDAEIYEFVGDNLHHIREPSMRTYITARDLKSIGVDWRTELVKFWGISYSSADDSDSKASLVDELLNALEMCPDGMTKREIFNFFNRNISAQEINAGLQVLLVRGLVRKIVRATAGRPAEVWTLIINMMTELPLLPPAKIIDVEVETVVEG